MQGWIDLRSDTMTRPTREMRRAMAEAEVGDDAYGEDPTVNRLQEGAAQLFEKEAALFVPSGTMGNQIAVRMHARPGQEVVLETRSHIYNYERGAMSVLSGCLPRPVWAEDGRLGWEQIQPALDPDGAYRTGTGLIALENTHNLAGGVATGADQIREICRKARRLGIPVHVDGARIFNAAAALETSVAELTRSCDSVMFSFSKGLSAPVGSMLLGSREWIDEARNMRRLLGGQMRQAGVLAAAGLVGLQQMPSRLQEDHENARRLAEGLAHLDGISIQPENVQTNIVMTSLTGSTSSEFVERLKSRGILAGAMSDRHVRFVTYKDIRREDIDRALDAMGRSQAG